MRSFLFIVVFLFNPDIDYSKIFKSDYDEAIEFMESNEAIFESVCSKFGNPPSIISSIVFPEAIRCSIVRDYLEKTTLELVYVNTGLADFSIGSFQIKPSFAERIEFYAAQENLTLETNVRTWFLYDSGLEEHEIRKERLNRLKDTGSQLNYINFFFCLLTDRFPELESIDIEYLIRFVSTAYNYDFEASKESIIENMDGKFFPWGIYNDKEKFNYSDISWFYYEGISGE